MKQRMQSTYKAKSLHFGESDSDLNIINDMYFDNRYTKNADFATHL